MKVNFFNETEAKTRSYEKQSKEQNSNNHKEKSVVVVVQKE